MNKFNNHVFGNIDYCINCGLFLGLFIVSPHPRISILSCEQIVAIQKSHQFVGRFCQICGIDSFWQEYTCNEWLMIKANE